MREMIINVIAAWVILLVSHTAAEAAPVTGEILDYYDVTQVKGGKVIEIYFNVPIFYTGHFPASSGDTLIINLYAVAVDNRNVQTLYNREGLVVNQVKDAPLVDIEYSGAGGNRSQLILQFSKEVKYKVTPGDGFQSIRVELIK